MAQEEEKRMKKRATEGNLKDWHYHQGELGFLISITQVIPNVQQATYVCL